jgi:SpoVK/Ycf46/Vps4 family AAA+-type ATPase
MLDRALWRRFEAVWELTPPETAERKSLFERYLKEPLPKKAEKLFQKVTEGLSGADIEEISMSALRKRLLSNKTDLGEALLLSTIEYLRRQSAIPTTDEALSDRLLILALELKNKYDEKYSFNDLENLSGIPHSTIHSKVSNSEKGV